MMESDQPDHPAEPAADEPPVRPDARPRGRRRRRRKKPERRAPTGLTRFFLRGLVVLAPVVLTLVIFGLLFQMVNRYVTNPINGAIYWSLESNAVGWKVLRSIEIDPLDWDYLDEDKLPIELRGERLSTPGGKIEVNILREESDSFFKSFDDLAIHENNLRKAVAEKVHPVFGIVLSLLLVLWLGWLVGSFVGRHFVARLDQAMHAIPVVRAVYPYSKQLVEFFFAEKKIEFDSVVAVPYPSPGIWSLGFVTSSALKTIREETGQRLVGIFIPSSPMPMTGYTIFVPHHRLIPVPISVDEALRVTMTGGVLVPQREQVDDPLLDDWEEFLPETETSSEEHEESGRRAEDVHDGNDAPASDSERGE